MLNPLAVLLRITIPGLLPYRFKTNSCDDDLVNTGLEVDDNAKDDLEQLSLTRNEETAAAEGRIAHALVSDLHGRDITFMTLYPRPSAVFH
jgi:hypothetical protein